MSAHKDNHQLLWGVLLGSLVTASSITLYFNLFSSKKHAARHRRDSLNSNHLCPPGNIRGMEIVDGVDGLIGNTPLMRIRSLSEATGCTILVNMKSINVETHHFHLSIADIVVFTGKGRGILTQNF